jgi:hypothetical protein
MAVDDTPSGTESKVTVQHGPATHTGYWAATGNRLTVYLGLQNESAPLGMFVNGPEALARTLLAVLIDRQFAQSKMPLK